LPAANPQLAKYCAHKREALLEATEKQLEKVRASVDAGRLKGQDKIGVRVGRVVNQYKVAKHFDLQITDTSFGYERNAERIAMEAALDGLYIIRTSVPAEQMDAAECVRRYKSLADVERVFRTLNGVDLKIRPIHHRLEDRVRAHIFLCLLAYYVEWHMREAWRELMFADEAREAKRARDPVAPAKRSTAAERKAVSHELEDGTPAHNFATLIAELATIVRNTCLTPATEPSATFDIDTRPNPKQQRALELLQTIQL
jgi:transposase